MRILALTDGSVRSATALDAFDGRMSVDLHVSLAPLPQEMMGADLVILAFNDFPSYGMKPLIKWLETHKLAHKPRILCIPRKVSRQYSASLRLFADKMLPLPVRPDVMLDTVQRLDTRMPQLRSQERNETAATVQSTGRKFLSAFSDENTDPESTVVALSAATKEVCAAIEDDGLGNWLEEVNSYHSLTARHCMKVAGLASAWARILGVNDSDLQQFTRAALLHDIGKMAVPLSILDKPAALTPEEREIMKTHAAEGKRILEETGNATPLMIDLAYSHHELLDGTGYPRGLKGNEINHMVHCLTIVDIYTALVDLRPYKAEMSPDDAFAKLLAIPEKLDKDLVAAFRPVVDAHKEHWHPSGPLEDKADAA